MRLVFDGFEIDQDGPRLLREGREVPLERRTLDLLCYLAEHPGRLIRKAELLERVWSAHRLSEGVLSNAIAKLRKALGQGARDRKPIETVHGRGYRFHAVGELQPSLELARPSQPVPARVDPFVGRAQVLQVLSEAVDRAFAGDGVLVSISGEAGIGKSRTLDEIALRARARGFSVWKGAAYGGGTAPAYWPWIEIVRSALEDASLRDYIPADSWALATLVPELLGSAQPASDPHALRFRLFDELTRWFASAAARKPRFIALEDFHWADAASIELLGHLSRGLARKPVMFAITLRDHDPQHDAAESEHMQRVSRSALHVPLTGLSMEEVLELVGALSASAPDQDGARVVHELTRGNPFFVRQLVQLLAQRGQPVVGANLDAAGLPPAVRDVIQQRMTALAPDTRAMLRAAAVIGQVFDAAVLAKLLRQPLEAALLVLEPALRLGLVRGLAAPPHQFEFHHALLRDSLHEELSLAGRGDLHARLTRILVDQAGESDARHLAEVARHSLLAVPFELDACVRHCRAAADAAREASGFEAASGFLQRALERLVAEGGDVELRCELLLQLGLDQFCAGDLTGAWQTLGAGARLARDCGARQWLVRFTSRLASWLDTGANVTDLLSYIEQALSQLDDSETDLRAALLARRAELGLNLTVAERAALYAEAERLATLGGAPELLLDVAIARVWQRDPSQLEGTRAAITAYRALERRYPGALVGVQQHLRAFALETAEYWRAITLGDLAEADLAIAEGDAVAQASRVPQFACAVDLLRATRALGDGRLDDAAEYIERMRGSSSLGGSLGLAWVFCAFLLAEAQGDLEAPVAKLANLAMLDHLELRQRTGAITSMSAMLAKAGHPGHARGFLSRLSRAEIELMPARYGDLGSMCALAEAYVVLGDIENARWLYAKLAPYAALNAVGVAYDYKGSVAHYLGMLASALGLRAEATVHLEAAQVFNQKLQMRLQLVQTRALLARAKGLQP